MLPIIGVPETIRQGLAPYRPLFCREEGFEHVSRYVTGLILSPNKLTVSLAVPYAGVSSYEDNSGRIGPTHYALIGGRRGGRCMRCRGCRTPPAAARSTRSALVGVSRPASAAAPGGFHSSRTRPQSRSTPCDDASPPRPRS